MPFIALLYGYLFGSIPTSVIVGKLLFKQDPRELGSKNPGGTNSARLWGRKIGTLVILCDIFKAVIAFWTMWSILRYTSLFNILDSNSYAVSVWVVPLGAEIGHCFSVFLKFKGGKGVAVYVGSLGSSSLLQFIIGFPVFVVTAFKTKFVSLASLILSASGTIVSWTIYLVYQFSGNDAWKYLLAFDLLPMHICYPLIVTTMSLILVIRHIANIKRLEKNEENKIKLFDKKV